MKTGRYLTLIVITGIVILFGYFLTFSGESSKAQLTGSAISDLDFIDNSLIENKKQEREIKLYFYDNKTNCSLNGEVYVDTYFLGKSEKGILILKEGVYENKFKNNSIIQISGLTDYCFGKDSNLPFVEYWKVSGMEYYFVYNETLFFEAVLIPREPKDFLEMQGFVRPQEVEAYLNSELKKYLKNDTERDLDKLASFGIYYRDDWLLFKKSEYWQTPKETIEKGHGDCEDWAVTVLSLMRVYNSSIKCYNAVWKTHTSIFCYFNNNFIIYDQDKVKSKTRLSIEKKDYLVEEENKISVRKMLNNYFDDFGIEPDERRLYALFNEKELITFESNEDFVNWALSLS